jgi:hypothetical protein
MPVFRGTVEILHSGIPESYAGVAWAVAFALKELAK